mgnify:CR=1 FL=1
MHELSLTQNLINISLQHADTQNIKRISLRLGLLSCVDGQAIKNCFETIAGQYQQLKNAQLSIIESKASATCRECDAQFTVHTIGQSCECGSYNYELIGGDELTLSSIECFESA